ncbi:MAG: hypothetical protein JO322_03845 [Candidatus Eremiobacteraeota bacterium]|nr:hypothetical protein [Candidatus Eremiobacteraeota bacterium]
MAAAHIVLHLTLCNAMMHAPSGTPVEVKLHATDHTGRQTFDRSLAFARGDSGTQTVEFDAPRGVFRLTYNAPKFNCGASDYEVFLEDESRNMNITLAPGHPAPRQPTLLVGTAPQAFLFEQPTFVLLDKSIDCGKPVDSTLDADMETEYDPGSFHLKLYPTPDILRRGSVTLAFKVTASTGDDQFIRLKFPYPQPWGGWPFTIQFNLPEGILDQIATEQKGVLLCPKIYETSGG